MMRTSIIVAACPLGVMAETLTCDMDGVSLSFTIDRNQFVDPQNAGDPPRRKVTTVQMGGAQFSAEPFLMGDIRGFYRETEGGADALFVMQADGNATYSISRTGDKLTGFCEVSQ